ncbi:CUB and sushi domain-containing protein 1, partial [Stegodyphus mimosarum]
MQVLLVYALGIGIWGLEVVKAELTCDPPPVYNRTVIASGHDREEYPLGSNVTYRCDFGYASDVVIGSSRCILSKSNGKAEWTEPLIRCKPRSCGDPGFVSNAQRIGSLFTFPNSVQYECEDGYEIHGLSTRYCLASGSWSGTLPTCKKIHCGVPANPENGQAIYSSTEYEAEVKYRCNEGYSLSNKQPRICTGDGTWSGVQPVCTEGLCEAPVAPENGMIVIKPSVPRIGSIVSYACHEGFRLQGSDSARCLETGEWTFPAPKCLR